MSDLIEVKNLKKYFQTHNGQLHAVDDVNLEFKEGETVGVVGESGSGKSTLGRVIIHLLDSSDGEIYYNGEDITNVSKKKLKELRENMQIIFQDPYASLDPRFTVEATLKEPFTVSKRFKKDEIDDKVTELMDLVGIPDRYRLAYPHEMDGGLRQRVAVGRALALDPKFIVCDEPVSALDVSIQAQVLNLLMDLQEKLKLTYMFVSHDLSVIRHISSNVAVMYVGQIVEKCETEELFTNSMHPYTQALLSAIPSADIHNQKETIPVAGEITSPIDPGEGCRFESRCPYACERCKENQPLRELRPNHFVACCRAEEL